MIVEARQVTDGDTILNLDNAYVVEVEHKEYDWVEITFHDANGAECTLSVPGDHPLDVTFGVPF